MRFPNLLQKESVCWPHYTTHRKKGQNTVVFRIIPKERTCMIKEVGRFSWQEQKQMLDFFPVALLANERKKLNLLGGQFQVVFIVEPGKS